MRRRALRLCMREFVALVLEFANDPNDPNDPNVVNVAKVAEVAEVLEAEKVLGKVVFCHFFNGFEIIL